MWRRAHREASGRLLGIKGGLGQHAGRLRVPRGRYRWHWGAGMVRRRPRIVARAVRGTVRRHAMSGGGGKAPPSRRHGRGTKGARTLGKASNSSPQPRRQDASRRPCPRAAQGEPPPNTRASIVAGALRPAVIPARNRRGSLSYDSALLVLNVVLDFCRQAHHFVDLDSWRIQ